MAPRHSVRVLARMLALALLSMLVAMPPHAAHAQSMPPAPAAAALPSSQAPQSRGGPPIQPGDRVYTADQTSNTVSVIDPTSNTLLGTIPLGNAQPDDLLGALYNRQVGVHGLGFSPDGRWLDVVNVTSNSVSIIDTASNTVQGTVYVGRAPHEGFFTPDGKELWVAVRGQNYISVIDPEKMGETGRIPAADGVAMVAFRPDGKVAFVNSSRVAEVDAIDVATKTVIARIPVVSPFSPNLAVTPDGQELWLTHKDEGKTTVIDAQTFAVKYVVDTGRVTNHVNFVARADGDFAYVTIGGENAVRVIKRGQGDTAPRVVSTITTGATPHGIWPSPDSSRVYVGLEDGDAVQVIDTARDEVVATIPIGQAPQALVYVARGGAPATEEGLSMQGTGQPVVKVPLRAPATALEARGTAVVRRLGNVDHLSVSVENLAGGTYTILLTDTALPPFGQGEAVARVQVALNGRGTGQAQVLRLDRPRGAPQLHHVVVQAEDGSVALTDGGGDGLPGSLTASLPELPVAAGVATVVRGSAIGADALGNVRAIALTVGTGSDGTPGGSVRIFHRLGGQVVGVWDGQISCISSDGVTAVLTGTITVGEERAQNLDLAGRSFRVAVAAGAAGGAPDTFQVQVAVPQASFEPCSTPSTPVNTVTAGELLVAPSRD